MTASKWQIPLSCPPPPNFREAGRVAWAQMESSGPFGNRPSRGHSKAQLAGLRYEKRVHEKFETLYPKSSWVGYGPAPWISFRQENSGALRWSQPDGFILDWRRSLIIIVEVKIKHSTNAWWGLRGLYEPVCACLFGSTWRLALCEVVNYFEPEVKWPEQPRMVRDPTHLKAGEIGVNIWRA